MHIFSATRWQCDGDSGLTCQCHAYYAKTIKKRKATLDKFSILTGVVVVLPWGGTFQRGGGTSVHK